MQIAQIEAGLAPPVVEVGNLDVERDFLDVQDVADAYALAVQKVALLKAGVILNIASGIPRRVGDMLEQLLAQSQVNIKLKKDPTRVRSTDLPRVVGNAERAREHLTWSPKRRFENTVVDVLNYWRARILARR
jgi:GDP-4-dehydro-6-deoxy-D-mannose reductase